MYLNWYDQTKERNHEFKFYMRMSFPEKELDTKVQNHNFLEAILSIKIEMPINESNYIS